MNIQAAKMIEAFGPIDFKMSESSKVTGAEPGASRVVPGDVDLLFRFQRCAQSQSLAPHHQLRGTDCRRELWS